MSKIRKNSNNKFKKSAVCLLITIAILLTYIPSSIATEINDVKPNKIEIENAKSDMPQTDENQNKEFENTKKININNKKVWSIANSTKELFYQILKTFLDAFPFLYNITFFARLLEFLKVDNINPTQVTNLTAVNAYNGKIYLSWNPATDNVGIAFYRIYRDNTYLTQVNTLDYLDSGLNNDQIYSYQISAVDTSDNKGEKSNPASATPTEGIDDVNPSKVTGPIVTDAKDGKLNLEWNLATDNVAVDFYNIYRDGSLLNTEESTTYQDTDLNNNQEYCYEISAVDTSANEGEKSDERCGIPTSSIITNSSPEKPMNPIPEHNSADIILNPVLSVYVQDTDGDDMDISFKNASDNSIIGTALNVGSGTRASVTWPGLSHDTSYSWYAMADDKNGGTNTSDIFSFTTIHEEDNVNPSKVTGLTATNAYDGKIYLSWDPASDNVAIDFYKIYRDNTYLTQVNTLEYLDSGLKNDQSYSYQVSAVDTSDNEGEKSNPASATPTPGEDDATILPESGHIMIMGNGYLQINTTLNINDTLVILNGAVYLDKTVLHIWWNLTTGFFKINISSFNSDTAAETKLINFFLEIRDPTVNPENKITFYFNFVSMNGGGCLILDNQAQTGNLVFNGSIKIGSISGQISINNLKNVTLQGSFYADNYKEIQGEAYIEWNFTEDTPSVLLYGNLTRDAVRYLNIEDLLFEIEDMFYLSIEKINFSGNGHINIGEDIIIDSEIENLVIQNLHIEAYGKTVSLSGDLNLISSAEVYIKIDHDFKPLELALSLSGSLIITNFYLNLNNEVVISWNYAELSGYGSIIIGDDIILDATITKFDVSYLHGYFSSKEMTISGTLNLNATGSIYIKTDPAFKTLEVVAYGGGTLSITNFYVNLNNGQLIASGVLLYIDIPFIGGSFTLGGNLAISGTISSATLTSCYVSANGKNLTFTGVINANAGGTFYISTNFDNYAELTVSGGLGLTISNMILEKGNTFKFEAKAIGFTLGASVSATLKIQDEKMHLSGGGSAGFSCFITAGHMYWYKSNGNTVYITAHIPSLSLSLGASVDYIEIPIGGKENGDNGGGDGDDDDDKVKEITVQGDIILDGNLNLRADFTLQNKFKINVNVNGYAFLEILDFYVIYKEDNVQKIFVDLDYAKVSGNLGPNGHIIISDYIEVYGTGSGSRTVDIDFLTFAFVNYSGNIDHINFIGNTGPTINFYLGEGKISLQGTSGSGTHTLIVQNMYISGPNKTISVASITAYLKNSFYFGDYIELSPDGSLTINNFNWIDKKDYSTLLSIGSLTLNGYGYFYLNNNIKINGALSLTIQNINKPDKISVEYLSLIFYGSFSGEITASEGNIKITNGGSSVNIPSLTVTNLCGPNNRCLSFGGAITFSSSDGVIEIGRLNDNTVEVKYQGKAQLSLTNCYIKYNGPWIQIGPFNWDQLSLVTSTGSGTVICSLKILEDGSVELSGTGTDLHLENLRWTGKIKRIDLDFEGTINFVVNKDTKTVLLSATISFDINVEIEGWLVQKIKTKSGNFEGSILIDVSSGFSKTKMIVDCISLSVISEIEIYKTLVEKIKLTTLTVSNTLVTINVSDSSFSFDGDIHIASMIYRDNVGIDRITVTNIDVNGDIYVKKIGEKHFYLNSEDGFSFYASTSTIKFFEIEFTLDLEIQGDLEVWLREIQPEYNHHRIDVYIDNSVDLDLGIIINNYEVYLDADINNGGYLSIDWTLEGDCDGFIAIDSSYLSGNINLEAYYNGYGIKSLTFDYIDADGFSVQWDPLNLGGTLIPYNWFIMGSITAGSADVNFFDGNNWYNIYPNCIQTPTAVAGGPYSGTKGSPINFDFSQSSAPAGKTINKMRVDWDGDGNWDTGTIVNNYWVDWNPNLSYTYNTIGTYNMKLQVRDNHLQTSNIATAAITVNQGINQPCQIQNGYVTPNSGNTDTLFKYQINYYDPDGDLPEKKLVYIYDVTSGAFHEMSVKPGSETWSNGYSAIYEYQTTLSAGELYEHGYYFLFNDDVSNHSDQQFPQGGTLTGPTVNPSTATITGIVYKQGGGRLSGATVSADGKSTTTGILGGYELVISPGTHVVTASKSGYNSQSQTVTIIAGQTINNVDFTLSPQGNPPNTPEQPSGPSTGNVGTSYEFNTRATDPDGDNIRYGWDWNGDNIVDEWTDYWSSGTRVWKSHTWYSAGTYNIKVKAEDSNGYQSPFSPVKTIIISSTPNPEWVTPNGHYPSSGWNRGADARDNDISTSAESVKFLNNQNGWTDWLELTITPSIQCSKIRYWAMYSSTYIPTIRIEVYYDGAYHYVYEGAFTNQNWQEKTLSGGAHTVSKARIKFWVNGEWNWGNGITAELFEFQFWKVN
jgi:hypothetical protein